MKRKALQTNVLLPVLLVLFSAVSSRAATQAYWRFESGTGTAIVDSSINGNTGSLLGGAGFAANVPFDPVPFTGEPNSFSAEFDGSTGIAVIPDSQALRPVGAITVEALIFSNPGARVIVGKQLFPGCCVNSYQLEENPFRFQLTDTAGVDHLIGPGFEPTVGEWHHIAGTWDGATMRLYLDGVEVASGPFAGPIGYDTNPVLIGGEDDGLGIPGCCLFDGNIDEVRITDAALDPSAFLIADNCAEEFAACEQDLTECEATVDLLIEDLSACQDELAIALSSITELEAQVIMLETEIESLEAQIEVLQQRIAELEQQNAELLEALSGIESLLAQVESDFRTVFRSPTFLIPGDNTIERSQSLIEAILELNRGRKQGLFKNLGGTP